MILTVTINSLLERRYYYQCLNLSSVNRNGKLIIKAGGKGINVNRQLNKLAIKNIALLFTGGVNGKLMREILHAEKINFSEIIIKNETRDAAIIIDKSAEKAYSFFGSESLVSSKEVREFISKLEKTISTCEIVVFSGSSPCKEASSIFVEGINIANKLDKISVCDTYGKHLQDCYNSSPTIIHNNIDEIRTSTGLSLKSESDHLNFLNILYEKGVKQAYITNSGNSFYASNFDFHYKVTPPEIKAVDSTGSGDAFVAGIVYGWHNKLTFKQQLRFATATGAFNAKSFEVCDVEITDANSLAEKIQIEAIGKSLKEIDKSPE
ncbi:MAG: 1-phosphofructokinase [Ignavibacteria bacterium RBG_16_36_9]|nr:MAG: 1-phosphofructokinase [Ignavibacteria bacterium RBG_16_36_9]